MSALTETRICEICADNFNKGARKEISCQKCQLGACRKCYETFMMEQNQPTCMYPSCGNEFTQSFLVNNFTKSFITGPLKTHKENVYFDREKALLPGTQEIVKQLIDGEKRSEIYRKIGGKRKAVDQEWKRETGEIADNLCQINGGYFILNHWGQELTEISELWEIQSIGGAEPLHTYGQEKGRSFSSLFGTDEELMNKVKNRMRTFFIYNRRKYSPATWLKISEDYPLSDFFILAVLIMTIDTPGMLLVPFTGHWTKHTKHHFKELNKRKREATNQLTIECINELEKAGVGRSHEKKAAEKMFVRACPDGDCKGYLSSGWKCGMCENDVCSKCHIILDSDKNVEHVCDPEMAATAQMIAAESKPCPGCHVNIHKIDGCNQMWCTQCNTAWDWKSGKIETKVHNPHYFEYLRTRGTQGMQERNPDEVRCGRELDEAFAISFGFILKRHDFPTEVVKKVHDIAQKTLDFDRWNIHNVGDSPDTQYLRIVYMRNLMDEKMFKKRVQMVHKKFHKEKEIQEVYVMFKQTIIDILYLYRDQLDHSESAEEARSYNTLDEVKLLQDYSNTCLKNIATCYQARPRKISII